MKKLFVCLVATLSLTTAFAEVSYSMPSIEGGFKWNSMDGDGSAANKQALGLQFGGSTVINFNEGFGLRTGLFYSERPFKFGTVGSSDITGKITYADIPLHIMFKLEDYAGIYLGPSIATKIGDEVSVGSLTGVNSMITPITFGAAFKFQENMGLNIFFETIGSKLADGITASRGIGANFMFTFN
jgi:Outer membrane protein beta-barrel domain